MIKYPATPWTLVHQEDVHNDLIPTAVAAWMSTVPWDHIMLALSRWLNSFGNDYEFWTFYRIYITGMAFKISVDWCHFHKVLSFLCRSRCDLSSAPSACLP